MEMSFLDILSKDYSEMKYDDIRHIKKQYDYLRHWEDLTGIFSVIDGEFTFFSSHQNTTRKANSS
ncbi:hypothetical protein [Tenacibaculum piscium]|uniref:hypothetical protein n=1 Tax=Tenacibaculum piscium TaxID=1458515 RepID=UPI001F31A94C|nr:hypothetical protein [Tenacibaculum piscium]